MSMAITHYFKPTISLQITSFHSSPIKTTPLKLSKNSLLYSTNVSMPIYYETPVGIFTRKRLVPSVSGLWDAVTGGNSGREALLAIRRGMQLFREGDVLGSVVEFDKAIQLDSRQKAYLWQRGLSLYYLDRFEEGAEQFRIDVAQNPNDTEESIWCFLCEAQLYGVDEARKKYLEVGRDPRPVMREAYNMFKDGGDPEKLVNAFSSGRESEYFYASLYAGLYYECQVFDIIIKKISISRRISSRPPKSSKPASSKPTLPPTTTSSVISSGIKFKKSLHRENLAELVRRLVKSTLFFCPDTTKFLGICDERNEMILVFEYIPWGHLQVIVHNI